MAREYSDPDLAGMASKVVMRGAPPVVPPRGPIKPTAPDEGPLPNMTPSTNMIGTTPTPSSSAQMYIPGGSYHEVVRVNEGAKDQTIDYPIGTGAWQSRSHTGEAPCHDEGPMQTSPVHMPYDAGDTPIAHTEGDIPAQSNPSDSNAKSYDSSPICMDYGENG